MASPLVPTAFDVFMSIVCLGLVAGIVVAVVRLANRGSARRTKGAKDARDGL